MEDTLMVGVTGDLPADEFAKITIFKQGKSYLPAGAVDGLESCAHHLHGLVAAHGSKGRHERLTVQQVPQLVGTHCGQGVGDGK